MNKLGKKHELNNEPDAALIGKVNQENDEKVPASEENQGTVEQVTKNEQIRNEPYDETLKKYQPEGGLRIEPSNPEDNEWQSEV